MKNKIIIVLLCLSMVVPHISFAQIPFGGRIVAVNDCFCSGGWMMWIFDPGKKIVTPIVFQFGISAIKANYNIFIPGVSTLGSALPGGICTIAATECTVTIPAIGTVTPWGLPGIGTSLLP
jgi:hypothetical protein